MRRIGLGCIGLALWLCVTPVPGAGAAAVWTVVRNADCTAAQAATGVTAGAVNCCQGLGTGFCDRRENAGALFIRYLTLATGATQTYTATGGDLVTAANLSKLNIANVVSFDCSTDTVGHGVRINLTSARGTRAPQVRLWNGTTEIAGAVDISGVSMDCIVAGY